MLPAEVATFFLALSCCHWGPVLAGLPQPFDRLYYSGVRAYFQKDWLATEEYLLGALQSRAQVRDAKLACHAQCQTEEDEDQGEVARPGAPLHLRKLGVFEGAPPVPPSWPDHLRELGVFEGVLRRAECQSYCLAQRVGPASRHRTTRDVEDEFRRREPYNYLQVALFQLQKLDEAASAAHTYFVANPRHLQMKEDMAKYQKMPELRVESFRDLEAQPHWEAYEAALRHYDADRYQEATVLLEASLNESFKALEECRVLCEGPHNEEEEEEGAEEKHMELYEVIADHYMQVLKCKQQCVLDIATKPGRRYPIDDFLPSHFDLLHFAYASVGDWQKAIECAHTFLLFYPHNQTVAARLSQYQSSSGEGQDGVARENVRSYIHRSLMEKGLIYYAVENLDLTFDDPDPWTPEYLIPEVARERLRDNKKKASEEDEDEPERGPPPYDGPTVTLDARQLNGTRRVVLDGLLSEEECGYILRLAKVAGGSGDGYRGRRSPHTPHENFQGLTILKALKMAGEGQASLADARLYLEASERSRKMTEWYFPSADTPLHFSYTHLVCRSAIDGQQEGRIDLSHPIHCILDPESQECWKEPPAYIHRDYSGVLYLNDDFEGGDLFFTAMDAATVTAEVRPKCGRLVAFSSGGENPHGVQAVTRGQRCAIALWFTQSPEFSEKERTEAEEYLRKIDESANKASQDKVRQRTGGRLSPEPPASGETEGTSTRNHKKMAAQNKRDEL
ncbi:prolyl 3-hydroxylase 3 [Ambystoma mexicanum]|uniref:prolyl 3-hydroxylase 3 n=1 Tax=Ambystoma mexicanum TaxID=8296 RepID=UPI0037E9BF7C